MQADYRFIALGDETRNRLDADIVLEGRWKTVSISNRARIEKEYIEVPGLKSSELVFRDRVKVSFRGGRRFQPFVGGELFQGLDEAGKSENKYRLTGGPDYDLTKKVTLSLFTHLQHDLGEATNETKHIIAGRFCYSF